MKHILVVLILFSTGTAAFADLPMMKTKVIRGQKAETLYNQLSNLAGPTHRRTEKCENGMTITVVSGHGMGGGTCADRQALVDAQVQANAATEEDEESDVAPMSRYKCVENVMTSYNANHAPFWARWAEKIREKLNSRDLCAR